MWGLLFAKGKNMDIENQTEAVVDEVKDLSLGRFMTYLQVMLNRMRLNQPDLTRYIDPELDMTVIKE